MSSYSDLGGSLLVRGTVESEEDLESLQVAVQSSNPPVEVVYHVNVGSTQRAMTGQD